MKTLPLYVAVGLLSATTALAQTATSPIRAHVETLASEKFAGREAGSSGERLAADYIAGELARLGARPLPGRAESDRLTDAFSGAPRAWIALAAPTTSR
jgi:hypothetical protein